MGARAEQCVSCSIVNVNVSAIAAVNTELSHLYPANRPISWWCTRLGWSGCPRTAGPPLLCDVPLDGVGTDGLPDLGYTQCRRRETWMRVQHAQGTVRQLRAA